MPTVPNTRLVVFAYLIAMAFTSGAHGDDPAELDVATVRDLLQRHCVECHGGEETFAGVNLSVLNTELDVWQERAVWSRAQFMIEGGDMPPEGGLPLSEKDRIGLAQWIQHTLDNVDVERIPRNPGFVPPRRLTGREYNFTVQDLFGLKQQVYQFPEDLVIGDSFDNSVDTLNFEALWFEKALDAADATVRAVWADREALDRLLVVRPSPPPIEDEAIFVAPLELSERCDMGGDFSVVAKVVGMPERLFLRSPLGKEDILGTKSFYFDDEALIYRISRRRVLRAEELDLEDDEAYWIGLTVREGQASLYINGRLLVSRPHFARPDMQGHLLKIGFQDEEEEGEQEEDSDRLEEFMFYQGGLSDEIMSSLHVDMEEAHLPKPTFRWVAGMKSAPPKEFVTLEQAAEVVMREFLAKAFRRPPTRKTMDHYLGLLEQGLDAGLTFELAMQFPVTTALSSPAFLLRTDTPSSERQAYLLSDNDLANRLSYFLWASMPDDQLRDAVRQGLLTDPDELIRQTDRMLADPKADRFFKSFVLQWLRTEGLGDTIRPSAERFPHVSDELLESMRREGPMFFADAVINNRSLLNLIEAPYALVNSDLAAHYGYPAPEGSEWRKINLNDSSRGGLLTQAAVLTVSSSPQRTSPVFRGKWVLEVLLGDPPPPPPPNVPSLPATDSDSALSLRKSLELHRSQPACAGCHSKIDPYGLAMEQYDAIGALRKRPQDTTTTLHTGEQLRGVADLKHYLATQKKNQFLRHVTRKMLAYAVGREIQFPDERTVHEILKSLEDNDYGARTLIHQVVLSEPFRYRQDPPADE